MKKKFLIFSLGFLTFFSVFLISTPQSYAFSLGDIVNNVKNVFIKQEPQKKEITVDANITLAPDGDVDNNSQIDSGDTVRFEYTIKNPTNTNYTWMNLNTKINRKYINFIHNEVGVVNLNDDGKTIVISNIPIPPNQDVVISFDARVNTSTDQDLLLSTEPELVNKDKKSILKGALHKVTAKKITEEKMLKVLGETKPK